MRIKAGAVSYLNTKPLVYGFESGAMEDEVDLIKDYPARIASMLLEDEIDIGLVPVAIIPKLSSPQIITDYCIGCDGEVASVCIFSDVPMAEIKEVLLDYQSRTSVRLARILLKEHWRVAPVITNAGTDFRSNIKGTTAGLVIGDRAFEQRKISKYIFDLGLGWKEMTGLPFVFATWVSNKALPAEFLTRFNETTGIGLREIQQVVAANQNSLFDAAEYFTRFIRYELDHPKRKAMELFLDKISGLED